VAGEHGQRDGGGSGKARLMTERPTVYYDGGCPVCSREISFYRRRPGGETFAWVDVSQADEAALGPGLSRAAALARIHVRRPDGGIVNGAAAFAEIWRGMPGLRWLARLLAIPPFGALAELGYAVFLRARPLWRSGRRAR
jgi:predicted DCC family thiol-disulfide oxidoreductase YuxK